MKFRAIIAIVALSFALAPGTRALAPQDNASAVVEFDGTVSPAREAEITPIVDGWLNKINFKPGQYVQKGDVLFCHR